MSTMTDPTIAQDSFRFRNDDGSQSTATWNQARNVSKAANDADQTLRLRFLIKQTDSAANQNLGKNYKLRYSLNGGAYTDVAAQGVTSSPVAYADSSNITDNVATTQQLGVGTFVAGAVDENGDTGTITFSSGALSETEVEFVIKLVGSQITANDTLDFRVYTTASVALNTYTRTPRVTVKTFYSGGVGLIQSIQEVSIAIGTGQSSNTATINSVTTANTIVIFNGYYTNNDQLSTDNSTSMAAVELTNSTTVTAKRHASSGTYTTTLKATVIEFRSGVVKSIQRGTITNTSGTTSDATISAVDLNNAIPIYNGVTSSDSTGQNVISSSNYRLSLTSTTNLRATRDSTPGSPPTNVIYYHVLEFEYGVLNSFVQNGVVTIAAGSASGTATINNVNTAKTVCFFSGWSAQTNANSTWPRVTLTNGTTLTATREFATASLTSSIAVHIAEFESSQINNIQRGTDALPAASNSSGNKTVTSVVTGQSFLNYLMETYNSTGSVVNMSYTKSAGEIADATTLTFTRGGTGTQAINNSWELIEFVAPPKILTAASGTYSMTGTAATLKDARKIDANTVSYSISGSAATLKKTIPISAGSGSYSMSGATAALLDARKLAANSGSYSISGSNTSLLKKLLISAGASAYSLSGTAATIFRAVPIAAGSGAYAISGTIAALLKALKISAASGSYSLNGQTTSLKTAFLIAAGSGSYALSGGNTGLFRQLLIGAGAGSYAVSGGDASFVIDQGEDFSIQQYIADAVFDVHAAIESSYSGSGTSWENLVPAPADGSAQSAYNFTINGNPSFVGPAGNQGAYFLLDGTGDNFALTGGNTNFINDLHKTTGGQNFWLALHFRFVQNDATQHLISSHPSSTAVGVSLRSGSNENYSLVQGDGTNQVSFSAGAASLVNGQDYILIVSHDHAGNLSRRWINSATSTEGAHTFGTTTASAGGTLRIGAATGGGSIVPNGTRIYGAMGGIGYLSDADAAYVVQVFQDRFSFIAGPGAYSISGAAAGLRKASLISAASGQYNLTGGTAALIDARKIAAGVGSYSITGTAAGLFRSLKVSALTAAYSIIGGAVSFLSNKRIAAGSGAYSLSGGDTGLERHSLLGAGSGSYALSGTETSVLKASLISAGSGSYITTGSDVTLIYDFIIPTDGLEAVLLYGSPLFEVTLYNNRFETELYATEETDIDLSTP